MSSLLDIPPESIKEITISNPELPPETVASKFSRLHLSLNVNDKLVNVEIQVKIDNDYRDRTLFYWAKLYTSELKSGEDYGNLKQTITINIINFNMFEGNDYHTEVAAMIKGKNEIFSDKFSMHFFELKKISKHPKTSREQWLQFINADSETCELSRLREKALHDEASALKQATNEGITIGEQRGIAIGKEKALARMIEKLRAVGMTEEQIEAIVSSK